MDVKKAIETLSKLEDELYELAATVYAEAYKLDPERFNEFLATRYPDISFNSDRVILTGTELWGYGGEEHHSDSFPTEWLWTNTWRKKIVADKKYNENLKLAQKAKKKKDAEAAEYKRYLKLKNKYG